MVHTGFAVRFALVREMCDAVDVGGGYCLVFRCGKATESNHARRYMQSGLAKVRDAPVGYEVLPLTPGLQRRLGWGDVRTDDAFVTALINELHTLKWSPEYGSYLRADEFTRARSDLAAQELLLRVPGIDIPRRFLSCETQLAKNKALTETQGFSMYALPLVPSPLPTSSSVPLALEDGLRHLALSAEQPDATRVENTLASLIQEATHADLVEEAMAEFEAMDQPFDHSTPEGCARINADLLQREPPRSVSFQETNGADELRLLREGYAKIMQPFHTRTLKLSDNGAFEVYQPQKEDVDTTLAAMKRELAGDITFERLLAKFTYFVRQCVPQVPAGGGFELAFKRLISKHRAAAGTMCLSAAELDQLDIVIGRVRVKRCGVCSRPTDGREFHVDCATVVARCRRCGSSDIRSVDDTNMVGRCGDCFKTSWPMRADVRLVPKAAATPRSSKVSRKRAASQ